MTQKDRKNAQATIPTTDTIDKTNRLEQIS